MRIYFDFYGDFKKVELEECCFGAIEFDYKGKHYIVDAVGEIDFDREDGYFGGRFKGDYEQLTFDKEKPLSREKLEEAILNMDTSTFQYNVLDDGKTLDYKLLRIEIWIRNEHIEFYLCKDIKARFNVITQEGMLVGSAKSFEDAQDLAEDIDGVLELINSKE